MTDVFDLHVLVVDDEPANVLLLERILRRGGYHRVTTATDPRVAIGLLDTDPPDLLLLDLHMPHLDGFAVMEHLQQELGDAEFLPVLVLTADATEEAKRRALTAGGTDFLTKPLDATEVLLRVKNLLITRSLHLRLRRHNEALEEQLREHEEEERRLAEARARSRGAIEEALAGRLFHPVFQPIVDLRTGDVLGAEALTRFTAEPKRSPDVWFGEAAEVGLRRELELAAVHAAFEQATLLPEPAYLSVNFAPETVVELPPSVLVGQSDPTRLTLEVTEHAAVSDYPTLLHALAPLRQAGVRLAIDDAGAGFASLRHIVHLDPDIIKLDIAITRSVDTDPARRAMAAALVSFARDTGGVVVAEGIETAEEVRTLRDLGIGCGQGYHLARPGPATDVPASLPID